MSTEQREELGKINGAMNVNEWLNSCPLQVVSRVLNNKEDILHLASSAHLYDEGMLVTVRVDALSETIDQGLRTRIK